MLHDFDKSGLSILHTLRTSSRRYRYTNRPRVIDLGLRLADVQEMDLESEPVDYDSKVDPRVNLRESGASAEECAFLVQRGGYTWHGGWGGQRVELNAMASDVFVEFLKRKLAEVGVKKVVPDEATLAKAYRRAYRLAVLQRAIDDAIAQQDKREIVLPEGLLPLVTDLLDEKSYAWDEAVWRLACVAANGASQSAPSPDDDA